MSKKISGIYQIKNLINGKVYVGSSVNIEYRFRCHKCRLNKNNHHSIYLQRTWNKYGEENFEFKIIELVDDENLLIEREQFWIDELSAVNPEGYNANPFAGRTGGIKGRKLSEEHKRKIGESGKGREVSQETRDKIREGHLGKKLSEEHKEKMSKRKKGKRSTQAIFSEEDVKKIKTLIRDKVMGKDIAEMFGVTPAAISLIKLGKNYADITI